jgi:hypothetical protein
MPEEARSGRGSGGKRRRVPVVYGLATSTETLVFIPKKRAVILAKIQTAIELAKTWGDYRHMVPREVFRDTRERCDIDLRGAELDAEPFEPPGSFYDGDWPGWPAQEMLNWVPESVQDKFGQCVGSVINGPYLELDWEDRHEIVKALESEGFRCVEDQNLVDGAWEEKESEKSGGQVVKGPTTHGSKGGQDEGSE